MDEIEAIVADAQKKQAAGQVSKEAVAQLIREVAFTHLNRLAAWLAAGRRQLLEQQTQEVANAVEAIRRHVAEEPHDLVGVAVGAGHRSVPEPSGTGRWGTSKAEFVLL